MAMAVGKPGLVSKTNGQAGVLEQQLSVSRGLCAPRLRHEIVYRRCPASSRVDVSVQEAWPLLSYRCGCQADGRNTGALLRRLVRC